MNAKELFKKLGYKQEKKYKDNTNIAYESELTDTRIVFHTTETKGNRLQVYALKNLYQDSGMLTFAELKAIMLQIEELGWNDDTKTQINWVRENNK